MPLVAFWFSFYTWEGKKRGKEKYVSLKSTDTIMPLCGPIIMAHIYWVLPMHFTYITPLHTDNTFTRNVLPFSHDTETEGHSSRARTWTQGFWFQSLHANYSLDCPLGVKTGRKHLPKIILMEGCLENMQSVSSPRHFKFHLQIKQKHWQPVQPSACRWRAL